MARGVGLSGRTNNRKGARVLAMPRARIRGVVHYHRRDVGHLVARDDWARYVLDAGSPDDLSRRRARRVCIGGWLAIQSTFFASLEQRTATVQVFGARAPLGAWVAILGSDGDDYVRAIRQLVAQRVYWVGCQNNLLLASTSCLHWECSASPMGALLLVLTRQNHLAQGQGSGLLIWVGGMFVVLGGVFILEYSFPNLQHASIFYKVAGPAFAFRLAALGRAVRTTWPATRVAAAYILIECLVIWILPLFPAQPKLAPIYNPVTHMVPPPFPLLLIFPAIAMDLVLRRMGDATGWRQVLLALVLAAVFLAVFIPVQWFFAKFLLSPQANNWFFVGNRVWAYSNQVGEWSTRFWRTNAGSVDVDPLNLSAIAWTWTFAAGAIWIGLLLGGWMRRVQR